MADRNYKLYKENIGFNVVQDLKQYINTNNLSVLKLIISAEKDLSNIKTRDIKESKFSCYANKKI